jgi:flagellar motility protein MotE (MotC chaperone)
MKLNLNKKLLMTVGIYVGSFVVINVGMYFFLNMTQPKLGARVGMAGMHADSLHADSLHAGLHGDSTAAPGEGHGELAHADSAGAAPDSLHALAQATDSPPAAAAHAEEPAAIESPATEETAATDTPPEPEAESAPPEAPVATANNAAEMAKLAKALEAMKPDAAAGIAAQLTTDQIVALVMRMKDRTAGRMLAALPPDQAAQVALRMSTATMQAGRK